MPRNRSTDEARQPILRDNNHDVEDYQDNELEEMTCCNPHKSWFRFVALIFMCLVGFGECWSLVHNSARYQISNYCLLRFAKSKSPAHERKRVGNLITQRKTTRSHMFRVMTRFLFTCSVILLL